jgi:hypothetical protein
VLAGPAGVADQLSGGNHCRQFEQLDVDGKHAYVRSLVCLDTSMLVSSSATRQSPAVSGMEAHQLSDMTRRATHRRRSQASSR